MRERLVPTVILLADQSLELTELVGGAGFRILHIDRKVFAQMSDTPLQLDGVVGNLKLPRMAAYVRGRSASFSTRYTSS